MSVNRGAKDEPLPAVQPVALSLTVPAALNLLGDEARAAPLTPAVFFTALARAVFADFPVAAGAQEARNALEAAGLRGAG